MGKCEHKRTAINAGLQIYCFECGKVLGDVQVELQRLQARVEALQEQNAQLLGYESYSEQLQQEIE